MVNVQFTNQKLLFLHSLVNKVLKAEKEENNLINRLLYKSTKKAGGNELTAPLKMQGT